MEMKQVSDNCYAVLNEKDRLYDANSGLINRAGGVVIDTQSDLGHARQMIEMFSKVWPAMPKRVINTHEDADHVWGNQLFEGAEIIAHRSVPERMEAVAGPRKLQELLHGVGRFLTRQAVKAPHPGVVAARRQLLEPVEVAALFDFGLPPRHLKNSAEVLMKYGKDSPQTAPHLPADVRKSSGKRLALRNGSIQGYSGRFIASG